MDEPDGSRSGDPANPVRRVAICVSGHAPLAEGALSYVGSSFPPETIVHYYFYLWRSGFADLADFSDKFRPVLFGSSITAIAAIDNVFEPQALFRHHCPAGTDPATVMGRLFAIKQCNTLKTRAEIEHGFTYDIVVHQNATSVLTEHLDIARHSPFLKSFVVVPEARHVIGRLDGGMQFSSSANMDRFSNVFDLVPDYCACGCALQCDDLMRFHVMRTKMDVLWKPWSRWIIVENLWNDPLPTRA